MNGNKTIIFYLIFLLTVNFAQAQINIGSKKIPELFSALEINSSLGGLRLPQLKTIERDNLIPMMTGKESSKGLTVFNIMTNTIDYWNGSDWIVLNSIAASNGLKIDNNNMTLGGSLSKNTIIDTGNNEISIQNTSKKILSIKGIDGSLCFDNLSIRNTANQDDSQLIIDGNNNVLKMNKILTQYVGGYRPTTANVETVIKKVDAGSSITRVNFIFHVDSSSSINNGYSESYVYGDFVIMCINENCNIIDVNLKGANGLSYSNQALTISNTEISWLARNDIANNNSNKNIIRLNRTTGELTVSRYLTYSFLFHFMGGF